MNSGNLIAAIYYINTYMLPAGTYVTAIQYEDGSGCKFNYQSGGSQSWQFTELPEHWLNGWNESVKAS
jgi:hypothetical protein